MKCVTIIGARPQFIKAAPVSAAMIEAGLDEILIHTGQHYDYEMSQVFFDELKIPPPKYNLDISGGSHAQMTGQMLESIEAVIIKESPDFVLVYGDTNSTLAGSLAASKIHVPVVHMEAGLRSFNKKMPEEVNRILTDHISALLLCPSDTAISNLKNEGIVEGVLAVGDIMADAAKQALKIVSNTKDYPPKVADFNFENEFDLLTLHRAENTDSSVRLESILEALATVVTVGFHDHGPMPVILPLHPRTKARIESFELQHFLDKFTLTSPLGFLAMVLLERRASLVLTDSGGVQKEAFLQGTPCVTVRTETEWVELVECGWNMLAEPSDPISILNAIQHQILFDQ